MEIYFAESEENSGIPKPPPDVYELFSFYNRTFFFNILDACELKWSKRMTLCAGTCQYSSLNSCTITLSQPLLQYRSNNDIKETLIHEMIHAYLFLTNPSACKEFGGHGKEFQHMMSFINEITRLNITIFHSFHDEVDQMRVHIWKCDGKCIETPPYFGIVKRAMNRQPGPSDNWWNRHHKECGGKFTKIDGPEFKDGVKKIEKTKKKKKNKKITEFLIKNEEIINEKTSFKVEKIETEKERPTQEHIFRFKFAVIKEDQNEISVLKLLVPEKIRLKEFTNIISTFFKEFTNEKLLLLDFVYSQINLENSIVETIMMQGIVEFSFLYMENLQFSLSLEFIYDIAPSLNPLVLKARNFPLVFGINSDLQENLLELDNKESINFKLKNIIRN